MKRQTIQVSGMSCGGCEQNVENALQNVGTVTQVEADHEADTVEVVVEDDTADEAIHDAIRSAGYDVSA